MEQRGEILVETKDLSKNFGVTQALDRVSMQVCRGEIHGLIGENGSGKSTMASIIAGIQPPSSGGMTFKGEKWAPANTLAAVKGGVGMVVQEAGTISNITIAENIFLGSYHRFKTGPLVSSGKMNREAKKALEKIGITNMDPSRLTNQYDMQERKLAEIAKTVYNDPDILIIDETSTVLSLSGREILYRLMHTAADEGKAVIFISHDLDELMEHCTILTILRDGVIIDTIQKADFEVNDIRHKMVGREIKGDYYRSDNEGYCRRCHCRCASRPCRWI